MIAAAMAASAGGNWWEAGGATGCIAAYTAKGAASFAASKVNLANPGTFDATDGTAAPAWTSGNGWDFNSTNYLITGVQPDATWTMLIQVNTIGSGQASLCGIFGAGGFFRLYGDSGGNAYYGNGLQTPFAPGFTSPGNIGFAGLTALRNGVIDGTISGTGYTPAGIDIYIGGRNTGAGMDDGATFKCTAFGIWNNTLSSGQYGAVVSAMAAL